MGLRRSSHSVVLCIGWTDLRPAVTPGVTPAAWVTQCALSSWGGVPLNEQRMRMHSAHWSCLENLCVFHCKLVCNSEDGTPVSGFPSSVPEDVGTVREAGGASARLPGDQMGAGQLPSGHTVPWSGLEGKTGKGGPPLLAPGPPGPAPARGEAGPQVLLGTSRQPCFQR